MKDAERFEKWLKRRSIVKNFGGQRAAWEGWKAAKEDEREKKQEQEVEHE